MSRISISPRRAVGVLSALALAATTAPMAFAAVSPPIKVIQNLSETLVNFNGYSCNSGGFHSENHWYRRFDVAGAHGAATGFTVSSIVVGVESTSSSDGTVPGDVTIWAIDSTDALVVANLEPVATIPVNYQTAANLTLLEVPLTGVVAAGKDLVVEASVPPSADSDSFFLGANNAAGETAEDYIRAPACGADEIRSWGSLGIPDVAHILFAKGKANECISAENALPGLTKAVKKAKKSVKRAKTKLRKAKASGDTSDVAAAEKALKKAKKKLKRAKTRLSKGRALAAAECAQPPLPAIARSSAARVGSTSSLPGYGFSTR